LKLESEISKLKEAFEILRDEHASLVSEKILNLIIESPKKNSPKYNSSWMDFSSCETCPRLHEEIKYLNKKLEQASKGSMTFVMNPKDKRTPFKRPYTMYSYVTRNKNIAKLMNLTLGVTIVEKVVTPHLIATLGDLRSLKG